MWFSADHMHHSTCCRCLKLDSRHSWLTLFFFLLFFLPFFISLFLICDSNDFLAQSGCCRWFFFFMFPMLLNLNEGLIFTVRNVKWHISGSRGPTSLWLPMCQQKWMEKPETHFFLCLALADLLNLCGFSLSHRHRHKMLNQGKQDNYLSFPPL